MEFSAQQIADFLGGTVVGNPNVTVSDFAKIEEGRSGTLTFLSNPKYTHYIYSTKADVVLVNDSFTPNQPLQTTLVKVKDAYQALAQLLTLVESMKPRQRGVHSTAVVPASAKIGKNVYIGAYAVLGKDVRVGDNSCIYPHVFLDDGVCVGSDSIIYAGVAVYAGCVVGNRCIVHAGAVLGADGFGFAPDNEGHYKKIPQIGNVVLEDDVEIGANTTIDRATMGSTFVRRGVKVDNLVQIAHNVEIGEDTAMAAQTGIAGSTKIGRRCMLGGQVGVAGHINVADGSMFGAQTGIAGTIKQPGSVWQGSPAVPIATFYRSSVALKQLPDLLHKIYEMERKIKALEAKNQK